jgi:SAM-dependent methyltransferase
MSVEQVGGLLYRTGSHNHLVKKLDAETDLDSSVSSTQHGYGRNRYKMKILEVIQRYTVESYGVPGSNMELRSSYQFERDLIAKAFLQWAMGKRRLETIVDIGSSTGFLTKKIKVAADKIIAVDVNQKVLDAINDPDITAVQDMLPQLGSLGNASADVVISTDTLYYLPEDAIQIAIDRIHEILKPGGYLIFNDNGNAQSLSKYLAQKFTHDVTVQSPNTLKRTPNFDRLYWIIESQYLYCRGLFNALADPAFDSESDLSELKNRKLVTVCLRHRWLEKLLWLAWLPRFVARQFWSSSFLLNTFCVTARPKDCLWVYQKKSA